MNAMFPFRYVLVTGIVDVCRLVAVAEAQVIADVVSVIHMATSPERGRQEHRHFYSVRFKYHSRLLFIVICYG